MAAGGTRQQCLWLDLTCVALEMGGLTAQVKGLCLLSPLHKTHSPEFPHGCGSCPPLVPALATGNLPLQVWHMIEFFRGAGWRDRGGDSGLLPSPNGNCLLSDVSGVLGVSSSLPGHETPGQKEAIHREQAEAPCMGSQACVPQKTEPTGSVPGESS